MIYSFEESVGKYGSKYLLKKAVESGDIFRQEKGIYSDEKYIPEDIIIAKSITANNADMYMFTFVNNMSNVCPSSKAKTAMNISNGGNMAPIRLKRNMFDLLSFRNSICIKVNILSP